MRMIDAAEIRKVLSFPILIDALAAGHRRARLEVQDGLLGSEQAQYLVRHAVDPGRYMASKLVTSFPANLTHGRLPAVQAVCILFDGKDGRPLALIDGTELTYWRTAADSALGARLLANPELETMLVVGAGQVSRWLVRAHCAARPSLRRILVWNRTAARAAETAASLRQEGFAAEATSDLDGATRVADLISTCTRSHDPLVEGALLKRGVHLDLVGGYTPQTREADDEAASRSLIFVDRREFAFAGVGDILGPIESGAISAADVLGDLYDLVSGAVPARRSETDITLFKNCGGGHLDLMTAVTIFERSSAI
jgi:ornithine cyclodeaminase